MSRVVRLREIINYGRDIQHGSNRSVEPISSFPLAKRLAKTVAYHAADSAWPSDCQGSFCWMIV